MPGLRAHRAGFTLVETVAAVGVSSILMLALGSAVLVASRAVPSGKETLISEAAVERGFSFIRLDLEDATALRLVATTLHVAVPDRDGDGVGEVITYAFNDAWLTRSHNLGTVERLVGPIKDLSFTTDTVGEAVRTVRIGVVLGDSGARTLTVSMLNTPVME